MVLPIGFFMPLPLAMMIPFMGIQSAVMAKQFGENFQYGKRRISAMSNEEFNKLTPKMIQDNANAELKAMIPSMEQSVQEMRVFQTFLIREFLRTLNDAIKAGFGELFGINQDTLSNIEHYLHGHGGGHDGTTPPPPPPDDGGLDDTRKDKDKPPPPTKLQNFSNLPTALQKNILSFMQSINSNNKFALANAGSKVQTQKVNLSDNKIITMWKTQYISVNGYINPDPHDAMPWLRPTVKAKLRDWKRFL